MSITNFFKPAPKSTGTTLKNKKRKLDEIEDDQQSNSQSNDDPKPTECEPSRKRIKLTEESEPKQTPSIKGCPETKENQENEAPPEVKPADITFSNCHQLLPSSWKNVLKNEFKKKYFKDLFRRLAAEQKKGTQIFPPSEMVFRAFELCPWDKLKVVILGQDPYHDDGQAEGICFSVQKGIKIPPSLRNMYKEAASDVGFEHPKHGSLVQWGQQGILLLNTVLTVKAHHANSHKKFGWTQFTDSVIQTISRKHDGVVFVLWGKQAQKKKDMINTTKHKVVESAHPSPLSASRGFFGSRPYSKCNRMLKEMGKTAIEWQIDPLPEAE